jgi:hypothetical protein
MAAGTVYFSAINNTVLPLSDATMPVYIGGQLYLPYSFFSSDELGVFSNSGTDKAIVYASSQKKLTFLVNTGEVFDQDGFQHERYSAKRYNGIIYVPVELICDFFGLASSDIPAEPANIIRVRTLSNSINDKTFPHVESIRNQLQAVYEKYTGIPSVSAPPSPSVSAEPTYRDVSVYLSFFQLSGGKFKGILNTLSLTSYKACFFVSADEVKENADLLRRANGKGHMIGIRLIDGTYDEYQFASALLFEAAQVRTVLVASLGDSAQAAEDMAKAENLVFWQPTRSYGADAKLSAAGLTDKLSKLGGTRESLFFGCGDKTAAVLPAFLSYLTENEYNVRRIVETSIPVMSA